VPPEPWTQGSHVFDAVADTYDARRPGFPGVVFEEVAAIAGLGRGSLVVEIGPGTGQATIRLAELGTKLVAIEPGPALVELLSRRVAVFPDVTIVRSRFEDWEPPKSGFDAVVAASSWHWLDPATRWQKAHDVLSPSGWLVLLGHIVVADPGELEVFAETADLHEAHASGHPGWGHPPAAQEVIAAAEAVSSSMAGVERVIGRAPDPSETDLLFQSPVLRWYRQVQHFDGHGYVEHLRTTSLYGSLGAEVREPLLSAIEQRIRDRMDNKATRRYLISARLAQRQR
jgi:SAM-dependent methyltransferase